MESVPMDAPVIVRLDASEIERLQKDVNGTGGFQSLLKRLRTQLNGDALALTPDLASRVLRYCGGYGGGGFQYRLSHLPHVVEAAERMLQAGQYLPHILQVPEDDFTDGSTMEIEDTAESEPENTAPIRYSISSYGADYTVDSLVKRMNEGAIFVPPFQRGFVWTHRQASRFIESLLLGLPAPGIFLSRERESKRLLVIDGQQRLRTLQYFCNGSFGESGLVFSMVGVDPEFEEATYATLSDPDRRALDDCILHATVVRQDEPSDDESSIYYIFERINTGGTELSAQEIRSCIYQGSLNDMLKSLNKDKMWRAVYGSDVLDARSRDQELVLRFLAMYYDSNAYLGPMAAFLNRFMQRNKHASADVLAPMAQLFESVVAFAAGRLGTAAFRPGGTLNAAVCDAMMVGIARRLQSGPVEDTKDLLRRYEALLQNMEFLAAVRGSGSEAACVARRLSLATVAFAEVR